MARMRKLSFFLIVVLIGCQENYINEITQYEINKKLILLSPMEGDSLKSQTLQQIKWTSNNISEIDIELSVDNGTNWINIEENLVSINDTNIYLWNVPLIESDQCRILIRDSKDNNVSDTSNVFTVYSDINKELLLISPKQGELFTIQTTQQIKWVSNNISEIDIELSVDNGMNWTNIEENLVSINDTNIYLWNVPIIESDRCKILIRDSDNLGVADTSNIFQVQLSDSIKQMLSFMPLQIGNKWFYQYTHTAPVSDPVISTEILTMEIIDMVVDGNGNKRYVVDRSIYSPYTTYVNIWIDLATGDLFFLGGKAVTNCYKTPPFYTHFEPMVYIRTLEDYESEIFGHSTTVRKVFYSMPYEGTWFYIAKNFGLNSSRKSDEAGNYTHTLRGCILNNVVYGDTSLVID